MNLRSNMNEYHAQSGSNTMFDFKKGNPLATTNVNDMHKDAGAKLSFNGATGNQQMGVVNQFMNGSQRRLTDALASGNWDQKATATDNHFDTFNDKFKAFDVKQREAFGMLLLI